MKYKIVFEKQVEGEIGFVEQHITDSNKFSWVDVGDGTRKVSYTIQVIPFELLGENNDEILTYPITKGKIKKIIEEHFEELANSI